MADDANYHRSLIRHGDGPGVDVYAVYTHYDGSTKALRKPVRFHLKRDQDFNKYATNWEKAHSIILNDDGELPMVDSGTGLVLGYYGWAPATSIWFPRSAPQSVKIGRQGKEVEVRLGLHHLVNNFYDDSPGNPTPATGSSVVLKREPYPVYVADHNPFGDGSYIDWRERGWAESYRVMTDVEGRVIAVTESDIGGSKSPTNTQILLGTIFKVVFNVHLRNPLIKSFVSGLWSHA